MDLFVFESCEMIAIFLCKGEIEWGETTPHRPSL